MQSLSDKEEGLHFVKLIAEDKKVLDDFLSNLRPFKRAPNDICGEKKIEGSKLYLVMSNLKKHIISLKKITFFVDYKEALNTVHL